MPSDPLGRGRADRRSGRASKEPSASTPAADALVRALHDEHAPALFAYAMRRCGDRSTAEEIVQESLVAAWRHHDQFDPARGSQRQWLFGIARNRLADRARRERRGLRLVREPHDAAETDADLERVVEASRVADALGSLSVEHRLVIVEAYYEGRSTRDIAARHGVPPGTVKSRLFYGLRALRNALEEAEVLR